MSNFTEKDLGFLRIGSLNVRVKKTTEAFSNFLGVGSNNNLQYGNNSQHVNHRVLQARGSVPITSFDMIHKTWGSADNIPPVIEFHHNFIIQLDFLVNPLFSNGNHKIM